MIHKCSCGRYTDYGVVCLSCSTRRLGPTGRIVIDDDSEDQIEIVSLEDIEDDDD
jgi:hypothetical protein